MELYSKIVEFFDNNEEKKKEIHNNYTLHIVLIAVLSIFVFIGFYYISDIMSVLGYEYRESTGSTGYTGYSGNYEKNMW